MGICNTGAKSERELRLEVLEIFAETGDVSLLEDLREPLMYLEEITKVGASV